MCSQHCDSQNILSSKTINKLPKQEYDNKTTKLLALPRGKISGQHVSDGHFSDWTVPQPTTSPTKTYLANFSIDTHALRIPIAYTKTSQSIVIRNYLTVFYIIHKYAKTMKPNGHINRLKKSKKG